MISIRREAPAPPALLDAGAKELAKWHAAMQRRNAAPPAGADARGEPAFAFKAYGSGPVRDALMAMFHGKCAYCESSILAVTTIDVEHWRPKGRIKSEEGPMYEGYAWLAADWHNLVAACPNCNRPTKHPLPGGGVTAGKGMRFPLATARTKDPAEGDELTERPLLLNPTDPEDDRAPELHLAFATPAELATDPALTGILRAREPAAPGDPLGTWSIDVYALNWQALVDRRAYMYRRVAGAIVGLRRALERFPNAAPGDGEEAYLTQTIKDGRAELRDLLSEDGEYLLLVRQYAAPILEELDAWEQAAG